VRLTRNKNVGEFVVEKQRRLQLAIPSESEAAAGHEESKAGRSPLTRSTSFTGLTLNSHLPPLKATPHSPLVTLLDSLIAHIKTILKVGFLAALKKALKPLNRKFGAGEK
jgi:hypothetical protein